MTWKAAAYELPENNCVDIPSERAHFAAFVVTTNAPSRSEAFVTYWPGREALLGPPVVLSAPTDRFWLGRPGAAAIGRAGER